MTTSMHRYTDDCVCGGVELITTGMVDVLIITQRLVGAGGTSMTNVLIIIQRSVETGEAHDQIVVPQKSTPAHKILGDQRGSSSAGVMRGNMSADKKGSVTLRTSSLARLLGRKIDTRAQEADNIVSRRVPFMALYQVSFYVTTYCVSHG